SGPRLGGLVNKPSVLTRLDKWLAKHRPRFRKALRPGATPAQLAALAKSLGRPVHPALAELLAWHNGQGEDYAGYFEDHRLLMSTDTIAAAKADLDANALEHGWNKDWVPFLDDDGGNFVVLDLSKSDPPVLACWMDGKPEKLAPSLQA